MSLKWLYKKHERIVSLNGFESYYQFKNDNKYPK